jgi:hypothetical protein
MIKSLNELSENLLLAVKKGQDTKELIEELSKVNIETLLKQLREDGNKKAFWINIYNSYYQIFRTYPTVSTSNIYSEKHVQFGNEYFSLDDIEHGILRKYRIKIALGYLPNLFAPRIIKNLAVKKIDYRIHFALNCGAKSCPPIAFYTKGNIAQQLDIATLSFLESETEVILEKMEIHTSSLLSWYRGDFGGISGIKKILSQRLDIPTKGFKVKFKPYSWEDDLGNFA